MPDNILRVGAEFDVGPLVAGTQQAVLSFDQMKVRLMEFSTAADAAGKPLEAQAARILALGLSSETTKIALDNLGMTQKQAAVATEQLTGVVMGETAALEAMAAVTATAAAETEALGVSASQSARIGVGALMGSSGRVIRTMTTLAAQSEVLGPLLTAAFPVFAAIALVEILGRVADAIKKGADNLMGYTEEVQKAEKENIKWSQTAETSAVTIDDANKKIAANLRVIEEQEERTWGDKAYAGAKAAEEQRSAWLNLLPGLGDVYTAYQEIKGAIKGVEEGANEESRATQANIKLMQEKVKMQADDLGVELKLRQGEEGLQKIGETRVKQAQDHVQALRDEMELQTAIARTKAAEQTMAKGGDFMAAAARAELAVREEYGIKIREAEKQTGQAILTQSIDTQKAITEADKTVGLARVAQREALAKQEYEIVKNQENLSAEERKAALAKETTALENAETEKFTIERTALEKKRDLLSAQAATGKDTTPERIALNAQISALEVKHETEMSAIHAKGVAEREALDKKAADEKERNDAAVVKMGEEIRKKDLEEWQRLRIEKTKLEQTEIQHELEQEKFAADNKAKIKNAGIFAASPKQQILDAKDAYDEEAKKIQDIIVLEMQLRDALVASGLATTDPKIQASLQREEQEVQKLNVAWQKYEGVVTKAAVDQEKTFKAAFDKITGEFNRSVLSWMQGTETFGQAMMKMYQQLAATAVQNLMKIAEQEMLGHLLHKQMSEDNKLSDAKDAARGAFRSVFDNPALIFPLNAILAPAAAAAAFAGIMAFEGGGIMPAGHRMTATAIRPEEMVLPAHISKSIQGAVPSIQNFNTMMAGASPAVTGGGTTNKTMHNNIRVNITSHGGSGGIDHDAIISAVKQGIRKGSLSF